MRNYPDFIKAFMEYTSYVEAPSKFLRWSAISTIAGALERKVWINFKDQIFCYPNHYICLIGAPGLAKKSSSSRQALGLLQEVEGVNFCGTQMTTAGLIDELRRVGSSKRFEYQGDAYAHSAVFIYSSEAAVTLKGDMQNMLIQNLTDLYDGGPEGWNLNAAWIKRLKNEETKIFNPCINLLACSTPVWLVDSIGKENLDSGFASRILFVVQKGRPERSFGWKKTPSMKDMSPKLVEDLIEMHHLQGEYKTSPCFREKFDELDEKNKLFIEKNAGHLMIGYYARKLWHTLKLAQVLQAAKSDEMILTGERLEEAVTMIEELESDMEGAFANVNMSDAGKLIVQVWNFILSLDATEPVLIDMVKKKFWSEEPNALTKIFNQLRTLGKLTNPDLKEGQICYWVKDDTPLD